MQTGSGIRLCLHGNLSGRSTPTHALQLPGLLPLLWQDENTPPPPKVCYTGVDQILTKYAGDSTQHQDAMLSREDASHGARCVCRCILFARRDKSC